MTDEELNNMFKSLNADIRKSVIAQGWIKEGKLEGIKEGKLEGVKEGKIEGVKEGKIKVAQTMLKDGVPIRKITKYTGLTKKDII